MDRPSQRPGEPTPESIYVEWLARRRRGEEVEFEEVCLAHPAAAETLRELHRKYADFEELERNFGLVGSVSERLASRYGSEVDPHVELEGEDAGDFTSKLLGRLSDRAPSSRRYQLKGEVATGGIIANPHGKGATPYTIGDRTYTINGGEDRGHVLRAMPTKLS